ncbi:YhcH/YjgK/YiaL family protein [Photobacterium nomapromontoriensis]|uniref:YhcH/YjgK/YiaL family protein n=1 Tax=Photobacterium nomapromontoriensis TaxID=2910237 RepID=UPI003D11A071
MYRGNLDSLESYRHIPDAIVAIIKVVKRRLNESQEPGRFQVNGDSVFYFIVNDHTQELADRKSEIHAKYMDVQIVLEGEEMFGFSYHPFNTIAEDFLAEKDLAFSEDILEEEFITLTAGDFVIFDTLQPHRPLVAVNQPAPVKKAVIKIEKAALQD